MEWDNIKPYLEVFKKIKPPYETQKKAVVDCVYKTINIKIENRNIKISNDNVFIKTDPIVKNEIFLHKKEVLRCIKNTEEKINIQNIK